MLINARSETVDRLFSWLQVFRRLVTRYEYHIENFLGMARLGCMKITSTQLHMVGSAANRNNHFVTVVSWQDSVLCVKQDVNRGSRSGPFHLSWSYFLVRGV